MNRKISAAIELLEIEADDKVSEGAASLVNAGLAHWAIDPHHSDVVGLIDSVTGAAHAIVYLEHLDFELGATFEEAIEVL